MKQYLICNPSENKGAIVWAEDMDEARKKAFYEFYAPYTSFYRNDLTTCQPYERGNHLFVSAKGNRKFKKVQFCFHGDGSGVTTSYNCDIDTQPTEKQLDFIGNSNIYAVLFYNTDIPQGNWGDKIGNKR